MLTNWKFWTVMGGITLLVALFAFGFTRNPKIVPSPLIGKPAPTFRVTELTSGQPLSSTDLRGKPFILNFWASWCAACREEAVIMEEAYQRYSVQQGKVKVIGIAIQDTPEKALAFARRFGKTYFLALDDEAGDIALNFGLYGVPETFFIDADGIIRYKQIGPVTPDVIAEQVHKLTAGQGDKS